MCVETYSEIMMKYIRDEKDKYHKYKLIRQEQIHVV